MVLVASIRVGGDDTKAIFRRSDLRNRRTWYGTFLPLAFTALTAHHPNVMPIDRLLIV